jgi:hypothetical protein
MMAILALFFPVTMAIAFGIAAVFGWYVHNRDNAIYASWVGCLLAVCWFFSALLDREWTREGERPPTEASQPPPTAPSTPSTPTQSATITTTNQSGGSNIGIQNNEGN